MTTSLLRSSLGALVIGAIMASSVTAQYFISYRYDGDYVGETFASPGLSNVSCVALPLVHIEIRNGILRAYDQGNRQIVKGFVTGEGFFNSDYILADGRTTLFEGIVDHEGHLTGGIVDGVCLWVVKLSIARQS